MESLLIIIKLMLIGWGIGFGITFGTWLFTTKRDKQYEEAYHMGYETGTKEKAWAVNDAYLKGRNETYDLFISNSKGDLVHKSTIMKYPIRMDHYDEENGNLDFILGIESVLEWVESLPTADGEKQN